MQFFFKLMKLFRKSAREPGDECSKSEAKVQHFSALPDAPVLPYARVELPNLEAARDDHLSASHADIFPHQESKAMDQKTIDTLHAIANESLAMAQQLNALGDLLRQDPAAQSLETLEARLAMIRRVRLEVEGMVETTRQRIERVGIPDEKLQEAKSETERVLGDLRLPHDPTPPTEAR